MPQLSDDPLATPTWLHASDAGWYPPDKRVGLPTWIKVAVTTLVVAMIAIGGGATFVHNALQTRTQHISQVTEQLATEQIATDDTATSETVAGTADIND